jgi:hypothetical protein
MEDLCDLADVVSDVEGVNFTKKSLKPSSIVLGTVTPQFF